MQSYIFTGTVMNWVQRSYTRMVRISSETMNIKVPELKHTLMQTSCATRLPKTTQRELHWSVYHGEHQHNQNCNQCFRSDSETHTVGLGYTVHGKKESITSDPVSCHCEPKRHYSDLCNFLMWSLPIGLLGELQASKDKAATKEDDNEGLLCTTAASPTCTLPSSRTLHCCGLWQCT